MMSRQGMKGLYSISLTHHRTDLAVIGNFLLPDDSRVDLLAQLKAKFELDELYYLCTCNRVELLVVCPRGLAEEDGLAMLAELWQGKSEKFNRDSVLGFYAYWRTRNYHSIEKGRRFQSGEWSLRRHYPADHEKGH
jgi:hypothetical protein